MPQNPLTRISESCAVLEVPPAGAQKLWIRAFVMSQESELQSKIERCHGFVVYPDYWRVSTKDPVNVTMEPASGSTGLFKRVCLLAGSQFSNVEEVWSDSICL